MGNGKNGKICDLHELACLLNEWMNVNEIKSGGCNAKDGGHWLDKN